MNTWESTPPPNGDRRARARPPREPQPAGEHLVRDLAAVIALASAAELDHPHTPPELRVRRAMALAGRVVFDMADGRQVVAVVTMGDGNGQPATGD